jgi:recombination protein RecA
MPLAATIRLQVESALSRKFPSALTPQAKIIRPIEATGIKALDELVCGGLPVGAVSELVGPESSGRTAIALSFLARLTQTNKVCAWIDVCDNLDPASAAACGVDLARLLWVRCGVTEQTQRATHNFQLPEKYLAPRAIKKGLHGGGSGTHPRNEVRGLSNAIDGLMQAESIAPRCAEPQSRARQEQKESFTPAYQPATKSRFNAPRKKPWSRIEQALKSTDLLLQGGGFSAIVLDMGGLTPEFVSRVPSATWFRYRAAAERSQSSILLLSQFASAKSSVELLLRMNQAEALSEENTVFTGIKPHAEVERNRFARPESNVVILRKPVQNVTTASWSSHTAWAGRR